MQSVSKQSANKRASVESLSAAAAAPSRRRDSGDDSRSSYSSVDIGKAGNKFMKKRPESAPEIPTVQHGRPAAVEIPRAFCFTCSSATAAFLSHILSYPTSFYLNCKHCEVIQFAVAATN